MEQAEERKRRDDENIKHLEMLQATVSRLAGNSFLIKGWTLTIAAAIFGYAANSANRKVAFVGAVVLLAFWLLDAYFLKQERLFRHLYNQVRRNDGTIERFDMDTRCFSAVEPYRKVVWSKTLRAFYGILLMVAIAVTLLSSMASKHP